ncbi:hypothetical protein NPIL_90361 [Nephila pilipes]|uniref:Uncharacterized protein n=1 Tax=Nephila pilipes TaxID=299642 RepID=A0A8X6N7Y1_NEPPI|nr:hypothetical protein NPIL_90361 [Nephila pilipes]
MPQDSEESFPDEMETKTEHQDLDESLLVEIKIEPDDSAPKTKDIRFTKTKFEPVIPFNNDEDSKTNTKDKYLDDKLYCTKHNEMSKLFKM